MTWSKSIKRMQDTPERANAAVQCDPTPPSPMMITKVERSFERPSGVKNEEVRVNCSLTSSRGQLDNANRRVAWLPDLNHSLHSELGEQAAQLGRLLFSAAVVSEDNRNPEPEEGSERVMRVSRCYIPLAHEDLRQNWVLKLSDLQR